MKGKQMNVPQGGVVKYTNGHFVQVFDKDGKVVESFFVADNDCSYYNEENNFLVWADPRTNFYAPFDHKYL
jgi:hypothetical protein